MTNRAYALLAVFLVLAGVKFSLLSVYTPPDAERVRQIYNKLWAQTGQTQDKLPLKIVELPVDNAFNDGKQITIYTGLINHVHSDDEVALVLGHEIAHGTLGLLNETLPVNMHEGMGLNDYISELEANADKMGAVYMMKAGYNICKGRNLLKVWNDEDGNGIGQDHPANSFRWNELNIGCGG